MSEKSRRVKVGCLVAFIVVEVIMGLAVLSALSTPCNVDYQSSTAAGSELGGSAAGQVALGGGGAVALLGGIGAIAWWSRRRN